MLRVLSKEIQIGDVISVNTGYRPLDDENCEVLDIKYTKGLFDDENISFFIKSKYGNHWYECPLKINSLDSVQYKV